jgi:hypothetical protein
MSMIVNGKASGVILDANGEPASRPTTLLTNDEAKLMRDFIRRIAHKHGLVFNTYCTNCDDRMTSKVEAGMIVFNCSCRMLFHRGQSF